jgi:GMP synthase (glutamine-hydrolysing)
MRMHVIQHVPFEGPASIAQWAQDASHEISITHIYKNQTLPSLSAFDWLIIMGGPMNIYEENKYSWLISEKEFIRLSIESGKTLIGICLGAQLIADALGAKVYANKEKEIGWFPIKLTGEGMASPLFGHLPGQFTAFHWHGDTFNIPSGAVHLAKSDGCENQAFLYDDRVLGIQFHLESTLQSVTELVSNCKEDITAGRYVQDRNAIFSFSDKDYGLLNSVMFSILDRLSDPEDQKSDDF